MFDIAPGSTLAVLLKNAPLPPLETRILAGHALHLSRVQLITRADHAFTADEAARLSALFARRLQGEPIAYLTGQREFYGLDFEVTPAVLIPRPETELLVELASEYLPQHGRMLDMGTGSGAIAVAVAHQCPDAVITALDASHAALAIAQRNVQRHRAAVRLLQSDWYAALGKEIFDLIVANPPYIAQNDPHLAQGDLRFEPADALTDHGDGLAALRHIIDGAKTHLTPNGWLLLEHGYDQAATVRALLTAQSFDQVQSWQDLAGIERVSGGCRPA
ncbi:MAG: peptide chain release factor N(5)-glutamine methyltransferase [Proteobacteria bacterium]|nr:peptide chain release factor N(5)-glutamine methyltransferase [Pseudomonadota bacterium]